MICPVNGFKVTCKKCNDKQCHKDMIRLEKELTACWNRLHLKDKYELIKQFERDYNSKIKIYNNIFMKLSHGRFNAFVLLPSPVIIILYKLFFKVDRKIRIYISKKLFNITPLTLLEYIILHEVGHTKSKVHNNEDCANSFALNKLGSNEYIKRKTQLETYIKYKTFDISQLKKLQNISYLNFIKLRLHLIGLEDL